jgi:hypothetical protein
VSPYSARRDTIDSHKEYSVEVRSARLSAPGGGRRGYRADILDIVEGAVEKPAFANSLWGLAVSCSFGHSLQARDDTAKQATATVT